MGRQQGLLQLRLDPLPGHLAQPPGVSPDGFLSLRLDGKTQLGSKPYRPQHPQGVLGKAPIGLPHAPDESGLQVLLPAETIDNCPVRPKRHGVDGKIPAGQILGQPHIKGHRIGVPSVGIAPLPAEGGHLHRPVLRQDGDRSMLDPGGDGVLKQGHDLLRPGGGTHVIIPRRPPQQQVPHAATYRMGGLSRLPQNRQIAGYPRRYGPFPHFLHLLRYVWLAIYL